MSAMRRLVRQTAKAKSYKKSGTTDMFEFFFKKIWRERLLHPASVNKYGKIGACKKGHKPKFSRA